uniref:NADH-ubiquinone oxidoreductase chain 6 n=1 Tax=Compsopogon caeruleus TaxID=31354 RepID=A0A1Z1XBG8_9RHOD|nr:NADH dehydrogenase subunit 6 [Compsopogon caeruleus]ARX96188.1 NADH dehydrogenase subunit 6 [Compsopogon caeruleus]
MFNLIFYYFSSFSFICALMVILSSNPVHSVLFLILVFCNVAGLLFLLGAEFLALLFIIVYVGAISVLFLFVVMMLNVRSKKTVQYSSIIPLGFFISSLLLIQVLLVINIDFIDIGNWYNKINFIHESYTIWFYTLSSLTNMEVIGLALYEDYSYLFILCSLILLVAMIGAIILTLHQRIDVKKQNLSNQLSREPLGILRVIKTTIL